MLQNSTYRKLIFLIAALVLINGITCAVLSRNQTMGLYPIDADSIGIPVMETILVSFFLLPILIVICALSDQKVQVWLSARNLWSLMAAKGVLALAYSVAFLFTIYGGLYWSDPDHYLIAVGYVVMLIALVISLVKY